MSQSLAPGVIFADRYQILECLGRGGMGTVYSAQHIGLSKKFAIKLLHGHLCTSGSTLKRFAQEAKAASAIEHQNIIEVVDAGITHDNVAFFVMEHLKGEDLATTFRRECPMPWLRAKRIALQLCDALQAAHDLGIIHRDVKPANCFRITRNINTDFIKILDFGIAKIITHDPASREGWTATGDVLGTIKYMAPEQAEGRDIDQRADIYSVGVILYQALTGRLPFPGNQMIEVLAKVLQGPPPPPSLFVPSVPAMLDQVILRALRREPEERFPSMHALASALAEVPDEPIAQETFVRTDENTPEIPDGGITVDFTTHIKGVPSHPSQNLIPSAPRMKNRRLLLPGITLVGACLSALILGLRPPSGVATEAVHEPPSRDHTAVLESIVPSVAHLPDATVQPSLARRDEIAEVVAMPVVVQAVDGNKVKVSSSEKRPYRVKAQLRPAHNRNVERTRPDGHLVAPESRQEDPTSLVSPECEQARRSAEAANREGKFNTLKVVIDGHGKCWGSSEEARAFKVRALHGLKKWRECELEGKGHQDPAIAAIVEQCKDNKLMSLLDEDVRETFLPTVGGKT